MKKIKNISIGFLVSFIGSIPIGYLNLVGLEIYSKSGFYKLVFFLFGIIFIEAFIIYFTLVFAKQLVNNKRLLKIIDVFSIGFMFVLAYLFFVNANQKEGLNSNLISCKMYPPFLVGIILNCLNFMQLPFWITWNLYLINGNHITIRERLKRYYIAGTLLGTFSGMLCFIVILQAIILKTDLFSKYLMSVFIPLFFITLGCIQIFKVYKKHFKSSF